MPRFDLDRFVTAQARVYALALGELRRGSKESHWMWFIFPQLAGLGRSATARFYGIVSAEEAKAYLAHPLLASRLAECTEAVMRHQDKSAEAIFGNVDAMKFRSSLTLFGETADDADLFRQALGAFYQGEADPETLRLLGR